MLCLYVRDCQQIRFSNADQELEEYSVVSVWWVGRHSVSEVRLVFYYDVNLGGEGGKSG